jgi:hypothetical protein
MPIERLVTTQAGTQQSSQGPAATVLMQGARKSTWLSFMDTVKVVNNGPTTYEFIVDQTRYIVPPGESENVPMIAAIVEFGNPLAVPGVSVAYTTAAGEQVVAAAREREATRVSFRHGGDAYPHLAECPQVELWTNHNGQAVRLITPWEDPQHNPTELWGEDALNPQAQGGVRKEDYEQLLATVEALTARIEEMSRERPRQRQAQVRPGPSALPPEDEDSGPIGGVTRAPTGR